MQGILAPMPVRLRSSRRGAILALALALPVGCVSVRLDVTFAPGSFEMTPHGTTVLQDSTQPPVHVGDGGVDAERIPTE